MTRGQPRSPNRLIGWQWPDGGWNCDRHVEARMSSVNETFLPLRGLLALGGREDTADRACEFLLDRHVIYRRTDGQPLQPAVAQLHYPAYWHYDLLAGLTALADARRLGDARFRPSPRPAESLRLEAGGWPRTPSGTKSRTADPTSNRSDGVAPALRNQTTGSHSTHSASSHARDASDPGDHLAHARSVLPRIPVRAESSSAWAVPLTVPFRWLSPTGDSGGGDASGDGESCR